MIDNDILLVNETLNGKIESFGMLVEKYQNTMFNLAYKVTMNKDLAKDIVQDSFIRAFEKLKSFNQEKRFFSWIYRITLNESINAKKRSRFTDNLLEDLAGGDITTAEEIEKRELMLKIKKSIDQLDDKYKTLIILKHYQELSYDEMSEVLNIPIGKVKSRLYTAREYLRINIEKTGQ